MPRGTTHITVSEADAPSCHIALFTYQQWNYGSLAHHLLQRMLHSHHEGFSLPLELRKGLPPRFINRHGLQEDALCQQTAAGKYPTSGLSTCAQWHTVLLPGAWHPGQSLRVTICSNGLQMMTHMPWRRAYASLQMLFNSDLCSCLLLLTAWPSSS